MITAKHVFDENIVRAKSQTTIYDYCVNQLHMSHETISDILRFQLIYAVSALDRYIHEVVYRGVEEIINNVRLSTDKYSSHTFKASTLTRVLEYSAPTFVPSSPSETVSYAILQELSEKLSTLSFQAPDKVKDGLSYIWKEEHKIQVLANVMGLPGKNDNDRTKLLEQTLKLIVERRNQIVHEGDWDAVNNSRRDITKQEANTATDFIENLCQAIHKEITDQGCYVTP